MAAFILRKLELYEYWEPFKARCAAEGRSQRWVVLELIKRYVQHGLD